MIVPNQKVEFRGKEIPVEELSKNSSKKIKVRCDHCEEEKSIRYQSYSKAIDESDDGKYYCINCWRHEKFLIDKLNSRREKKCLDKYGTKNVMQVEEFKDNLRNSIEEIYGVSNISKLEEIKDKKKQTCLVNHGVEYPQQSEEIRFKSLNRKNKDGTYRLSSEQKQIFDIIQEIYPQAELEKPVGILPLDIYLEVNNIKIDIECDGNHWHQDSQKDRKRDEIIKSKGYKILRIRYGHEIPDSEEILKAINKLLNADKKYIRIHSKDSDLK